MTKTFNEIDTNKGGFILFEEFAEWAIVNKVNINQDNKTKYLIDKKNP